MGREIRLDDILKATGGRTLSRVKEAFGAVGTDTRVDLSGQLFVALKGENFDAHDFLLKAVEKGAAGVLIDHLPESQKSILNTVTVVEVKDTLKGLQDLGRYWRRLLKTPIVAITGSNGKTTSKEFCAAIFSEYKNVHFNKGSFNNHWGVPLTLLGLQPEHEIAISEMGMNHPGEITDLVKIAEPNVVVCTMVGRAHLEGLGSIEGVAAAKEEIYLAAGDGSQQIFNLDNPHTRKMFEGAKARISSSGVKHFYTFSQFDQTADVNLQIVEMDLNQLRIRGKIGSKIGEVSVPVFGSQNLTNLMVAASCALAIGLTPEQVWAALPKCKSAWGRNQLINLKSQAKVLFDAYNANPDSQKALIENLKKIKAPKKVGVFGEMRELGANSSELHQELGELVASVGFDTVWFLGPHHKDFSQGFVKGGGALAKLLSSENFDEELAKKINGELGPSTLVSIKGSRGMKLERVLMALSPLDFVAKD